MRVPSRRVVSRPARASARRWWEVLATLWSISPAISSTERSPWASTSTISARRPLDSALATSAKPSNSASLAARSPMRPILDAAASHLSILKRLLDKLATLGATVQTST